MKLRSPQWATSALLLLVSVVVAGCNILPARSGPLPTPVFAQLEIPTAAGTWTPITTLAPPPEVLPTRGRAVWLSFTAPLGSTFSASVRAPDGTVTALAENRGAPTAPEDGIFQNISINAATNPPVHLMYVRAPQALADPANYDILVVSRSLRTDVTDSAPMAVPLRQRKVFTVTVVVNGDGKVFSTPPGIECGTTPQGRPLSPCTFEFGPGPVTLTPSSNNVPNTRFVGWSGNCAPNVQVCTVALLGLSATQATATFGTSGVGPTAATCPAAPSIAGLRWIDLPGCATGNLAGHPGISNPALCDAQGYFCCEPGPPGSNAPRCGGAGKIESLPDCRRLAPRGMLRQPGGCYEINSGP